MLSLCWSTSKMCCSIFDSLKHRGGVFWSQRLCSVSQSLPLWISFFFCAHFPEEHITEAIYDRMLNISPGSLLKSQSYLHHGHHLYLWLINRKCSQWPQFQCDWHMSLYELELDTKNKTGQTWGHTPGLPGWQDMIYKVTKPDVINCVPERAQTESHIM